MNKSDNFRLLLHALIVNKLIEMGEKDENVVLAKKIRRMLHASINLILSKKTDSLSLQKDT